MQRSGSSQSKIQNPKSKIRARAERAFTLLEVLVALALTMLIIPTLVFAYINILGSYDAIKRMPGRNFELATARNALLAEADYEIAQRGDQFDGATGRQVTWSAQIEPTTTADLFLVTFTCNISAGEDPNTHPEENITEVFRVLRPTWSQGTDSATLRAENRDRIMLALQPSPLGGIIGGDGVPSATSAAGKGKSKGNTKSGQGGASTGKGGGNTGKSGPGTGTGKSGGGKSGAPNDGYYFDNIGKGGNTGKSGGGAGNNTGKGGGGATNNPGAKGGRTAPRK